MKIIRGFIMILGIQGLFERMKKDKLRSSWNFTKQIRFEIKQ